MSKEPEVGDVFFDNHYNHRFIITHKTKLKDDSTIFIVFNGIRCWTEYETWLTVDYAYLGKSKVSIEDLFKTENEE